MPTVREIIGSTSTSTSPSLGQLSRQISDRLEGEEEAYPTRVVGSTYSTLLWVDREYRRLFINSHLNFRNMVNLGHIEFYQFGSTLIAVVVEYYDSHERAGLLVLNPEEDNAALDARIRAFLYSMEYLAYLVFALEAATPQGVPPLPQVASAALPPPASTSTTTRRIHPSPQPPHRL